MSGVLSQCGTLWERKRGLRARCLTQVGGMGWDRMGLQWEKIVYDKQWSYFSRDKPKEGV